MQYARIGAIAVAVTVAIMFLLIVIVSPLLSSVSTPSKLLSGLTAIAGSVAVYRAIAGGLLDLFRRSLRFRKWMLGPAFLEGTWIGFFPHSGGYHFTVEHFNQESGETKITGKEFDDAGRTYATWSSYASSISLEDRRLVYAYSCDVFSRDTQQQGVGVFSLVGKGKKSPPHILDGYATDLVVEKGPGKKPTIKKDPNREYKISDEFVEDEAALIKAASIRAERSQAVGEPGAAADGGSRRG